MQIISLNNVIQFKEGNYNIEPLFNTFKANLEATKGIMNPTSIDLTKVAQIESMLTLCMEHLPEYAMQLNIMNWDQDMWKAQLLNLRISNASALHEILGVYYRWKLVHDVGSDEEKVKKKGHDSSI